MRDKARAWYSAAAVTTTSTGPTTTDVAAAASPPAPAISASRQWHKLNELRSDLEAIYSIEAL